MFEFSFDNDHTKQVKSFRKETVKEQYGILNRLKSIKSDALTVPQIHQSVAPHFPILANKRCGQWYVQPTYPKYTIAQSIPPTLQIDSSTSIPTSTCYFKSTDGHFGTWNFPESRLNLNVLELLLKPHTQLDLADEIRLFAPCPQPLPLNGSPSTTQQISSTPSDKVQDAIESTPNSTSTPPHLVLNLHGAIIIDSTRKGKSFPDSFTRTIPIWCGVVNSAFGSPSSLDLAFTSAPWMSGSETDQIDEKIKTQHVSKLKVNTGTARAQHYSKQFHSAFGHSPQHHSHQPIDQSTTTPTTQTDQQQHKEKDTSATTRPITPVWLHRESYQSSVHIMNDNLYTLLTSHLFPIILNSSSLQQPDALFISSFLHHLIFKYNLGLYLNISRYYNTQFNDTYLNSIIRHFSAHFLPTLSNLGLLNSSTHQQHHDINFNYIITILNLLQPFLTTPLILLSISHVYRHNLTYSGTNTGVYKGDQGEFSDDSDLDHDLDDDQSTASQFNCSYQFTKLPNLAVSAHNVTNQSKGMATSTSNLDLFPALRANLRDLRAQNRDNRCKDLNYIPGAGDDEETWAKVKVWCLKSRSELNLGVEGEEEPTNATCAVPPSVKKSTENDSDEDYDDEDEDEDDGWEHGSYDEYDSLAPTIFSARVPTKLTKFYRPVILSCTFEMLYRDIVLDKDNKQTTQLTALLNNLYSNRDCWTIIFQSFFENSDDSNTDGEQNNSSVTSPPDYQRLQSTPVFAIKAPLPHLTQQPSSTSQDLANTVVFYIVDPQHAMDTITHQIKYNTHLASQSKAATPTPTPGPDETSTSTLLPESHSSHQHRHHIVVLESQNQVDPTTTKFVTLFSDLLASLPSTPPPTPNLHFIPVSEKRTAKLSLLYHIHSFLHIVYAALMPPSTLQTPQASDNSNSTSTTSIYLTNSTMELYFAVIITALLFSIPKDSLKPETSSTNDTNPTELALPEFQSIDMSTNHSAPHAPAPTTTSASIPQYTIPTTTSPHLHPPQVLPYTLSPHSPTTHATISKIDYPALQVHTTNATFSKQFIRQFITHVMSSIAPTIHNGIFLSRDTQQQLNQLFCHRVERSTTKMQSTKIPE